MKEAFQEHLDDPRFAWLKDWTATVDLTMQVNDSAGVSPAGAYVEPLKNAYNVVGGPMTLGGTTFSQIPQTFSLGAGVSLSDQATRTDSESFTLSLLELYKSNAACPSTSTSELDSNLGLRTWIDEALKPVSGHILEAGRHPSPLTQKAQSSTGNSLGSSAAVKSVSSPLLGLVLSDPKPQIIDYRGKAEAAAVRASKAALKAQAVIEELGEIRRKAQSPIKGFEVVVDREFREQASSAFRSLRPSIKSASKLANEAISLSKDAFTAANKAEQATEINAIADDVQEANKAASSAEIKSDQSEALKNQIAKEASKIEKPDPPINSISHSVQFVLTYGANISPS